MGLEVRTDKPNRAFFMNLNIMIRCIFKVKHTNLPLEAGLAK